MLDNTTLKELAAQIMPCDMSKPYAFVSYSKQDFERVYPCIIALQQSGCNIRVDKNMETKANHSWTDSAFEAIRSKNCVAVIFMISANSLISVPCFNEVMYSQKGQLTLNRHRNNPVKLLTVNADLSWNPRRTHFSQWVYDESDKYNDDSIHGLSTADRTLIENLGEIIEPKVKFNIPTSGDVATAFMNEVYGGIKEIDHTTVLPYGSVAAILKNISETMDKPIQAPIPEQQPVTVPPSEPVQQSAPVPVQQSTLALETFQQDMPAMSAAAVETPASIPLAAETGFFSSKKNIIITAAAGAAVVAALIIILINAFKVKNVTDRAYTLSIGDAAYTVTYSGEFRSGKPYGEGKAVFGENAYNYAEYEGTWENGYPQTGKMTRADKSVYEGSFVNGKYGGEGKKTFYDEDGKIAKVTEGVFTDGEASGQGKAIHYDENGNIRSIFEGEYVESEPNGKGKETLYYENGNTKQLFEGGYAEGKRNGQGKMTMYDENEYIYYIYEGDLAEDLPNGQGKETQYYENGDKVMYTYEGEYKDSKYNGKGKKTDYDENGVITSEYEGDYVDSNANGQGKMTRYNKTGGITGVYEGGFVNGNPNGQGRLTEYYENSEKIFFTYEGGMKDDKCSGKGKMTIYDENGIITYVHEGDYEDGIPNGQGKETVYLENSDKVDYIYEGEYKDNKWNGKGKMTFYNENGKLLYVGENNFVDGTANGPGTITGPDGTVLNVVWKDGKIVEG